MDNFFMWTENAAFTRWAQWVYIIFRCETKVKDIRVAWKQIKSFEWFVNKLKWKINVLTNHNIRLL